MLIEPIEKLNNYNISKNINIYSKYRRHSGFLKNKKEILLRNEVVVRVKDKDIGFFAKDNEDIVYAIAVIEYLQWDSTHFNMNMARLHCFFDTDVDVSIIKTLIRKTLDLAVNKSIQHISIDVDIDNYLLINLLVAYGFEVLDVRRTYFTHILAENKSYQKMLHKVRDYHIDDYSAVEYILESTTFESRFTRDSYLNQEKVQLLYKEWFYKLISEAGTTAQVVVFESKNNIVACGAIGENDFLKYGIDGKIRSGSVYACLPEGVGAYPPVLYKLTQDALITHGLVETTISLNNNAAIRVVEGVRPNKSVTVLSMRYINKNNI